MVGVHIFSTFFLHRFDRRYGLPLYPGQAGALFRHRESMDWRCPRDDHRSGTYAAQRLIHAPILRDIAEVLHAFDARGRHLDIERIINHALRLGDATAKRLGWVLEKLGVGQRRLERLAQVKIKGYRKLDPTGPPKGPLNRNWMVQENLPGTVTT